MSQIEAWGNNVAVRKIDGDEKSKGGLLLPQTAREEEKSMKGVVVSVGEGRVTDSASVIPIDCEVGETVVFMKFAGIEVTVGGEMFRILPADAIVAKIK